MTKEAALYSFWSRFLPAYEENSIYSLGDLPDYPYITYEISTGSMGAEIPLTASLWYRSTSWNEANAMKREIEAAIGDGGINLPCDNGHIRLYRMERFADNTGDLSDDVVKRIIMNITAVFNTVD